MDICRHSRHIQTDPAGSGGVCIRRWRWRESNPRPKQLSGNLYKLSHCMDLIGPRSPSDWDVADEPKVLGNHIGVWLLQPPVYDGLAVTCGRHSRGPRLIRKRTVYFHYAATPTAGAEVKPKLKLIPVLLALNVLAFWYVVTLHGLQFAESLPRRSRSSPCCRCVSHTEGSILHFRAPGTIFCSFLQFGEWTSALPGCQAPVSRALDCPYSTSMASPKL